jgi:hypothetical protein
MFAIRPLIKSACIEMKKKILLTEADQLKKILNYLK